MFADDSLILIRATEGDSRQPQTILQLYEQCSGQMINKVKSAVLFSKNTKLQQKQVVSKILQVTKETMSERYLGLLVHVGHSKTGIFAYLKEGFGKGCKGGMRNFFHGQARRF